jgi:hypothetical protein
MLASEVPEVTALRVRAICFARISMKRFRRLSLCQNCADRCLNARRKRFVFDWAENMGRHLWFKFEKRRKVLDL